MKAVKQRPFAFSCALFLATSVLMFFLPFSAVTVFAVLLVITEALFIALSRNHRSFVVLYLLPPLILASAVSFFLNGITSHTSQYDQKRCDIEFTVTDAADYDSFFVYDIKVTSVNGKKAYFNSSLSTDTPLDGGLFSSYTANVKLKEYKRESTPTYFSYLSKGVTLRATTAKNLKCINTKVKLFPEYYFKNINLLLSDCFEHRLTADANALCQAFLLGNRDKLSPNNIHNFRRLGLSHMLAVSGLHLSVLCLLLEKFF